MTHILEIMVTGSFKLKIIITGDPQVGKTSLRRSYLGKTFKSNYLPTISADFSSKIIHLDDLRIDCGIWDIAGHAKLSKLIDSYFRNTQAAILVCDITEYSSMDNIINWIDRILTNNEQFDEVNKLPLLVIANKTDLREPENETHIGSEEFTAFAESLGSLFNQIIPIYGETSAKTGFNVKKMFSHLIQITIKQVMALVNFQEPDLVIRQLKKWRFYEKYKAVEIIVCRTCEKKYQKTKKVPFTCEYCDQQVTGAMVDEIYIDENTIILH